MRPEAKVQRRGDRSAPDFSWPFASSAMYVASLREMTREKRNHIRHHQPQKPTVRESGVAPKRTLATNADLGWVGLGGAAGGCAAAAGV